MEPRDQSTVEGHFHVYAGKALTDPDTNSMCIRTDSETRVDICTGTPAAWQIFIMTIEHFKVDE